ncbi:hypothetical protein F2Q68_00028710 [Brassica cretica]|uniref:HTH myb-type domain-containing protein n=1 Tax=Brassica cretica TaxID=69181 RepID=A0A8S9GHE1_BRACR|nr:hypothetical protein F2Q68_00028710 [Brassica cretica]
MVQTDTDKMGLNLNLSMYSLAKPLSQFLDEVSRIKDYDSKLSEIDGNGFLRVAIETLKEEASSSSVMMASDGKLDVAEGAKVESDNKKNWMSSAQLWISNPNSQLQSPNRGGAFTSFNLPPPPPPPPPAPLSLRTPTSEILMDYNHQFSKPMQSLHSQKKEQRRRWSQELHRKFVDALRSLGGSQVATPKQIRDMMKVDGLTNDEVKSHLQKYRMHIRKHPLHPAKTLSSSDQPVVLDKETQSLISLTRSDSPQSPLIDGGLFSNNGHSSEEAEDEEKSDGRSWRSVSNKKKQGLDLEL